MSMYILFVLQIPPQTSPTRIQGRKLMQTISDTENINAITIIFIAAITGVQGNADR